MGKLCQVRSELCYVLLGQRQDGSGRGSATVARYNNSAQADTAANYGTVTH